MSDNSEQPDEPSAESPRIIDLDYNKESAPYAKTSPFKVSKPHVRKWLAYFLIGIFATEIMSAFIAFFFGKDIEEIKSLLVEVLGPTSALVGSAVGFYFSSNE